VRGYDDFDEFFDQIARGPWSSPDDPGHRVGNALRRLAITALAGAPSDEALVALADRLEALGDGAPPRASRFRPEDRPAADGSRNVRPNGNGTHPLLGTRNAVAPPIVLERGEDRVYGDVVYDLRFEGLPGLVQGGFIAAAFDVMLGQGVAMSGAAGVTGSLSVKYVRPTPLYVPLRYEAWFDRVDGRKVFASARLALRDTDETCAEAEGIFVAPRAPIHQGDEP
jgi:acyl-coenzyme A thioesterase PaaI-like protein